MAVPAVESIKFRERATRSIDVLRDIDSVLSTVEDFGTTDAERQAFFQAAFGTGTDNPDLTWSEFAAGIIALRAIRTAWQANRIALARLLR